MGSTVEKCRPLSCIDLIVYSSGRKEGSSQHLSCRFDHRDYQKRPLLTRVGKSEGSTQISVLTRDCLWRKERKPGPRKVTPVQLCDANLVSQTPLSNVSPPVGSDLTASMPSIILQMSLSATLMSADPRVRKPCWQRERGGLARETETRHGQRRREC